MAESYRGLTIRIGGDTSKLSQALRTANRTITDTDSALRKLNTAVKLDPSSIESVRMQMGAMADSAAASAMKLAGLKDALAQVSKMQIDNTPILEAVEGARNLQASMEVARSRVAKVDESLAEMHTWVSDLAKQGLNTGIEQLSKDWTANWSLDRANTSLEQMKEDIANIPFYMEASEKSVNKLLNSVTSMQDKYAKLTSQAAEFQRKMDEATSAKDKDRAAAGLEKTQAALEKLNADFEKAIGNFTSKLTSKDFNFDGALTSVNDLRDGLLSLPEAIRPGAAAIQMYCDDIEELQEEYHAATSAFDQAKVLVQVRDLQSEIQLTTAKITNLAKAMSDLKLPSELMRGMMSLTENIGYVDEAFRETVKFAREMSDAYKADPSDTSKLTNAYQAYNDSLQMANEKLEKQEELLSGFDTNAIYAVADMSKSAAEQAFEMSEAHAEAAKKLEIANGQIKNEETQVNTLTDSVNKLTEAYIKQKDEAAKSEALETLQKEQTELRAHEKALESLRAEQQGLAADEEELNGKLQLSKQREEYEEALRVAASYRYEVEKIESDMIKLSTVDATPKFDYSVGEALENLMRSLDSFSTASIGMTETAVSLRAMKASADEAMKSVRELDKLLRANPNDEDLRTKRAEAISIATQRNIAYQNALNDAIASVPSDKIDEAALAEGSFAAKIEQSKTAFNGAKDATKGLEKEVEGLEKKRDKLKEGLITEASQKQIDKLESDIVELRKQIETISTTAKDAFGDLVEETATKQVHDLTEELREAQNAEIELGQVASNTHKKLEKPVKIDSAAFVQASSQIAQAARRMANEIVTASNEIDAAYRDMRKTVNGTEEQFARLRDAAIEYSQTHITSSDTMLEMEALGGQLGVLIGDLQQFGKITSDLDISTDMGAEDVALKLGQISNVLQLDIDGMQGFSDAIVRLGNNMPAQESAIMGVAQRFAAVASTAHFSGSEVLAWSAAIASTGQRSEAAATAISNTVSGIEQAIASGGDDIKAFADIANMSAKEFVAAWKSDPTTALKAFIEGLNEINESDESAVAALENMGITGVRQQQTLLSLSQTIDNLGDALKMSEDAWNGVSDQWGQAGDAANEAQQKSMGFSGALQIMKNNAQNLAAAMGDSLVPFMQAAAKVLEYLTDVLNDMPAPIRTVVTILGGMGIAFGTVAPMINVFTKGWENLAKMMANTSSITAFINGITGAKVAMEGATTAATAMSSSIAAPLAIAAAVGITAFAALNHVLTEYEEKQERLYDATTGLATATQASKSAYDDYIGGIANSKKSTSELIDEIDVLIEKQATLAGEIRTSWEEIGTNEAVVDTYAQKIRELTASSELSREEQAELIAAVDGFNEATGSSIEVIDAQRGELSANADEIEKVVSAWKKSTEAEQAITDYNSATKRLVENTAELKEIEEMLSGTVAENSGWFTDMRDNASTTDASYAGLAARAEELRAAIDSDNAALENAKSKLSTAGVEVAELQVAIEASGRSLEDYESVTNEEWQKIASSYGKNVNLAIEALDRLVSANQRAASSTGTLALSDDFVNAAYESAKESFDAAYKAQQRANDIAYRNQQRYYDSVYKSQQKAFDAEYKNLQKQLTREYDARKKAYDAQLKELKKAQEAEVDAFEQATDAKLKSMEKEYNERVKLLELEYGGKSDKIDERIKALEAETEAEKKAIEERNENDKKAELQAAVTKAKSRRKRAEAEKALNDYLEELQQKHNEEDRKTQIEALKQQQQDLKDELSERKDALKEQYDLEVEAYKESRAAQLEAMQEANTLEYEAMKEAQDAQLEALKESQTAQLEALKESQTATLENIKQQQQDSLQSMKEQQADELEALKKHQQDKLNAIKAGDADAIMETDTTQGRILRSIMNSGENMKATVGGMVDGIRNSLGIMSSDMTTETAKGAKGMESEASQGRRRTDLVFDGIRTDAKSKWDRMVEDAKNGGRDVPGGISSGMDENSADAALKAAEVAEKVAAPIKGVSGDSHQWGTDFLNNFNNGMVAAYNAGHLIQNVMNIASNIRSLLHFSVPDKGPLADQDEWGGDFIQNLIDGMKSKEAELTSQVQRMASIIEDNFDPTMSVDAAYEAIDAIDRGKKAASVAATYEKGEPRISLEVNVNLSNVSIRDDRDIDQLSAAISQKMAAATARELAGRL